MLPTSANSSSSANDCGANVYNSEADLKFIQTSKSIYTKWHFYMGDFPFPSLTEEITRAESTPVLFESFWVVSVGKVKVLLG